MSMEAFQYVPGFCPDCGSILPPVGVIGDITCYACAKKFAPRVFRDATVSYTINFNSVEEYKKKVEEERKQKEGGEDGPVVERKCSRCGNESMTYATLQLRSADEGQTVFYTCTKCKFKESENS